MTEIKARPTLYKGTKMRSRLEADYAAELDRQHPDAGGSAEAFIAARERYERARTQDDRLAERSA